jgi:CheY-like chemotaxis protein/HPt (histidine-containing phosphotransfer) domain-containing protein
MKAAAASATAPWWRIPLRGISVPTAAAARLRDSPARERDLALYRFAAGGLVGGYLLIAGWLGGAGGRDLLSPIAWLLVGFELAALAVLCHLLLRPGRSAGRRLAGMLVDLGALSYCMHVGGETAAPLYPVYLLIVLTNGSRFGTRYLLAAAGAAVASLALATVATQFFAAHPGLSLGLLGGLIVPSMRAWTPMRRWLRARARCATSAGIAEPIASGVADVREAMPTAAAVPAAAEPAAQAPASSVAGDEPPRRLAVLIAEDNVTNQKVMAKILGKAGHEPHVVDNGQAAAEAAAKGRFDAVLMDLDLPVLNGIEAAKLIRFLSTGRPRIPIVALAAEADAPTQTTCQEAGIDACLAKPIEPAGLLQALDAAVGTRLPAASPPSLQAPPSARARQSAAALDVRTLESLKALGGDDFVEELAQQFIEDATGVLGELSRAVASGDAQGFREHAHALRSGAANIGAQGVYDMCLSWRRIDPATLSSKGDGYVRALEQEFGRVQAALQDYRQYRAARKRIESAAPQPALGATPLRAKLPA